MRPSGRRKVWQPAMRTALLACTISVSSAVGLAVSASAVTGQSARSLVEEGNRLYREGRFQEAHEKYMEAMTDAPDSPVIPFNAGNALYQDADYRRAMEAYRQAIASGDTELASDAWYNLGNALYRQQQLQPSLEAYKQALRLDPEDVDAKHNLERVLQQMQQQRQQSSPQDRRSEEDEEQPPEGDPQDPGQQGQRSPPRESGSEEDPARPPSSQAGRPEDQPPGEQDERPGGEESEQPSDDPTRPPPGAEDRESGSGEGGAGSRPRPDEMTEEEARRLLAAIEEDPEGVSRRPPSTRGRRPSKPW